MKMMMVPLLNIVIKGKVVSICMVKMVHCEVLTARNIHWLLLQMQHLVTKEFFCLFNVYSLVNVREKRDCWDSIRHQADLANLENIIIAGDLNLTLHSSEKRGGSVV